MGGCFFLVASTCMLSQQLLQFYEWVVLSLSVVSSYVIDVRHELQIRGLSKL